MPISKLALRALRASHIPRKAVAEAINMRYALLGCIARQGEEEKQIDNEWKIRAVESGGYKIPSLTQYPFAESWSSETL